MKTIKTGCFLLRDAYLEFQGNDPLRMAAATSFFASFALPPIMIILTQVLGVFGSRKMIRQDLFEQLGSTVDQQIALQTREIVRNVDFLPLERNWRIALFIFLLFVASTLFAVIKNSLNQIWKIKGKSHQGIGFILLYRLKSIGIILVAGLLFSLDLFAGVAYWWLRGGAVIAWFILILKYLSDGRPAWKTAIAGGIFTGLFFSIGEMVLHLVFSYNRVKTIYGASTSLTLLLLFIFYCSFIFYYGACFTRVLAIRTNRPIIPTHQAESIEPNKLSPQWPG